MRSNTTRNHQKNRISFNAVSNISIIDKIHKDVSKMVEKETEELARVPEDHIPSE